MKLNLSSIWFLSSKIKNIFIWVLNYLQQSWQVIKIKICLLSEIWTPHQKLKFNFIQILQLDYQKNLYLKIIDMSFFNLIFKSSILLKLKWKLTWNLVLPISCWITPKLSFLILTIIDSHKWRGLFIVLNFDKDKFSNPL